MRNMKSKCFCVLSTWASHEPLACQFPQRQIMKMFSVLLASASKDAILYSWSTPVISLVVTEARPVASWGSGYERGKLVSHLVSLTLGNAWHWWKWCHKVLAPASHASGPLVLCEAYLLPPLFCHLYCCARSPHAQNHPISSWHSVCP